MLDKTWQDLIEGAGPSKQISCDPAEYRAFSTLIQARSEGRTCVVGQLGLSLDGRIATLTGDSKYINGRDALAHLHRLRALVDAVIVGAGTAIADDPRLTVRLCAGQHPARVVIDPNGRVPVDAKLWSNDGCRQIVFGGADGLPEHVERIPVQGSDIPVASILTTLETLGLRRVLVEGGADTLARFLTADRITCLHLLYGKVIIGSGTPGFDLPPISRLSDAKRPKCSTHVFPDGDFLVACDLRQDPPE